ncbi:hypothetical protein CsSME_00046859 [Camellia sinensis var. sinensis]
MDSARSWLQKFQPSNRKKDSATMGKEDSTPLSAEEASNITKQKAAAAKQYIENHYKEQKKSLQERRERRNLLEKKLADADVSEEDQNNLLKFLEKKETEYMRLQRHKMGADDFELLTMIGKGAFGEVYIFSDLYFCGGLCFHVAPLCRIGCFWSLLSCLVLSAAEFGYWKLFLKIVVADFLFPNSCFCFVSFCSNLLLRANIVF